MKVITLEIICKESDENYIINELNDLQYGVYSLGTYVRNATEEEIKEVKMMVPKEVFEDYLQEIPD